MARKILLADDSVTAQNMGRKILADAGYEVIAVNNGSAALKKIAELKPDLVVLDVYMPGYSGLEVCQRLKESQDSARIPVLLSVGKLEPFKPEEAQRVRADGYIVKPFEASELLSALSKLEDKVVPRSEPSKPGRFARAIAAAEETVRGGRKASASNDEDNGWKERIAFPHPKEKEPEQEKAVDETSFYNPINRDLRTVVEKSAEISQPKEVAASPSAREKENSQGTATAPAAEQSVDVAALAPPGLPQDVTPEEIAAMAAAASRIQMASAEINTQSLASASAEGVAVSTATSELAAVVEAPDVEKEYEIKSQSGTAGAAAPESENRGNGEIASAQERPKEVRKLEEALPSTTNEAKVPEAQISETKRPEIHIPEESFPIPATMAASAESVVARSANGSRWTAVSVALEADEATLSLDQEMQQASAAFAAAASSSGPSFLHKLSRTENSFAPGVAVLEPPPASNSVPQSAISETESALPAEPDSIAPADANPISQPAAQLQVSPETSRATVDPSQTPEPNTLGKLAVPEAVTSQPVPELVEAPAEKIEAQPAPVHEIKTAAVASPPLPPEAQASDPNRVSDSPAIEHSSPEHSSSDLSIADFSSTAVAVQPAAEAPAPTAISAEPSPAMATDSGAETEPEQKLDPETVKTTAAAWASWRQVRDTGKPNESVQAQPKEFEVPALAQPENAKAVAAGAEQILQAVQQSSHNPADVASIVDSVLADLRPRLMEEISRKMAEKK